MIDECKVINLPRIKDRRGNLTFVEAGRHIPFDIRRVYYLYDVPGGAERGGHAHKTLHQFIIAMSGSYDVHLHDGNSKKTVHMNRSYYGLYLCPMIWRVMDNFSSGAVCIVLASDYYDESDYYREYEQFMGDIRRMAIAHANAGGTRPARRLVSNSGDLATSNEFEWPSADAFYDADAADIVGNGQAEFLGVALCNADGEPTRFFQAGDRADFFVAYRLLDDIDVPVGGVTIVNDRAILVHGKNSMQHQVAAPDTCRRGAILRFRQRIALDIAPGEYTFVVGLATIDSAAYRNCAYMSNDDLSNSVRRVLSVGHAGSFTVGLSSDGIALKHHGLANLPGECELHVINIDGERAEQ